MSVADTLGVVKGKIDEILVKFPIVNEPLQKLSEKVRVDKAFLAMSLLLIPLFSILLLWSGYSSDDFVAVKYPLYASIKAAKTSFEDEESVINSFFKIFEGLGDFLIGSDILYFLTKVTFLVWCINQFNGGAVRSTTYKVTAFNIRDFDGDFLRTPVVQRIPMLGYGGYVSSDMDLNCCDMQLTAEIIVWMRGGIGEGEESIIHRNDGLCRVYHRLGKLTEFSRNKYEDSTVLTTRSDRTDKLEGVPLVVVEEKDISMQEAIDDLKKKAHWLPHYHRLPFIFGIAITPRRLQIFAIPETLNLRPLFSADLIDPAERWSCVVAAVNIARALKCFVEQQLVVSSVLKFNVWHPRNNKRLRLEINFSEVEFPDKASFSRMVKFYKKAASVPHLEHLFPFKPTNAEKFRIRLVPVGLQRMPCNPQELVICIKQVLTCLLTLHELGFVHCDVRWTNIISYFGEWFVIDCEYACALTEDSLLSERSSIIKHRYVMDVSKPWSPLFDLYQVGLLLVDCPVTTSVPTLVTLRDLLVSKKFTSQQVRTCLAEL